MTSRAKSAIQTIFKVAFAATLIWWIFSTGKIDLQSLKKLVSPLFLTLGLTLIFLNIFAVSTRWRLILQTQGVYLGHLESLRLTLIGLFFNFAMPGGVGGDVVKAYYLFKERPQVKAAAITSVMMDRILGLYAMIVMALLVMVWDSQHVMQVTILTNLFFLLILLFLGATLFFFFAFSASISVQKFIHWFIEKLPFKSKFKKLYESTHIYGNHPKLLTFSVLISFVAQTLSIIFLIFAGESSGLGSFPYSTYFIVAPLGFMAIAIPISPAGLGLGQAAFYALFNIYLEHPTNIGPTVITALQAGQVLLGLVGAFLYMLKRSPTDEQTLIQEVTNR